MFTGIVEEIGTVRVLERTPGGARLTVSCDAVVADARVGDSVSVSGVCLTVTSLPADGGFTADLMGETVDRTALAGLRAGDPVNLERALRADGRLGGHLVQGHVDGVAEVVAVEPHDDWTVMTFTLPADVAPYVVEKGSVTVDGTSLTVMRVDDPRPGVAGVGTGAPGGTPSFAVGLIPHTLAVTTLGARAPGDRVNLEVDVVAKYVERMLRADVPTPYAAPRSGPRSAPRSAAGEDRA